MAEMASDCSHGGEEGRGERRWFYSPGAQVHTWPAWRGSARAIDQARPEEDFTGGGVAAQGAPTGDASTCAAQPPQPPRSTLASNVRAIAVVAELGGDQRWQNLSQRGREISSTRRWPPNPFGGGGRGHRGAPFAPGGGGGGHRRRPKSAGDGGGN
jgi:hypothetical protein